MLSLEQIQSFLSVYETGSYSAGGRKIGKDRTTVRERVVAMEEQIGEPLFTIEGKKAKPTELATSLYQRAWNINKQAQDFNQAAFAANKHQLTELIIHHHALTSVEMLADIDRAISQLHPYVKICWFQRHRDESFIDLGKGHAHLAIMPSLGNVQPKGEVGTINLGAEEFTVYVGKESALAKKDKVQLNDLTGELQLVSESAKHAHLAFVNVASQQHMVSNNALLMALLRSRGWTVLSRVNAQKHVDQGEIVELKIVELTHHYMASMVLFFALAFENNDVMKDIINVIKAAGLKHLN